MKSIQILLCLPLIFTMSCTTKNQDKKEENNQLETSRYHFTVPEIPAMISSREAQASYLAEHFWDNFNFQENVDSVLNKVIEGAFIEYLMIIGEVESNVAQKGVRSLMEKACNKEETAMIFMEKAEKLLYHPNSPIRNEFLYEEFLKGILECKTVETINKARFQYQYDLAQKNKPGTRASDFEYTLKDGSKGSLFRTPGEFIMIYFHNPGCHECGATKERIVNSPIIKKLKEQGKLKILAIYPDEDLDLWKKHYMDIPESWIHAYDSETIIQDTELYDLKAIPTIYLLDQDKTVLLRDPNFMQLEEYLNSI